MATTTELKVPDIGDATDVGVIEVLVQNGDAVSEGQCLLVLETDKATIEIPAEQAGVIRDLKIKVGATVSQGTVIALIEPATKDTTTASEPEAASASAPAAPEPPPEPAEAPPAEAPVAEPPEAATPAAPPAMAASDAVHASPSIRKLARELGVPLQGLEGTGARGRITADDVRGFVKRLVQQQPSTPSASGFPGLAPWPTVDPAKFGPVERRDLSRIRKLSAAALHRNWVSIPHVTNHEDADITELEAFRVQLNREHEKAGVKFTLLTLVIKACIAALKQFPEFNASLDGEQIVLKRYHHIGFAADTPNGLVVPVIRNADQKGLIEIARETAALAAKARDGKLSPTDMSGGSFSISSLGGIGGTYFTPIINAPEVAILGIGKGDTRVAWRDGQAVPRLVLPLSLSWDHRVIDGAAAGRFNACLARMLEDFRRVSL